MNTQFLESQIFQKTHFDFLILPISALSRLASMVVTLKTPLNLQSEKQQCTVIQPDDELLVKSFSYVTQSTGGQRFDHSVWFSKHLPGCDVNQHPIFAESVMSVSDVSPWGTPVFPIHMLNSSQTDDKLNYCPLLDTTFTAFCARPYIITSLSTMNSTVHLSHKQTLFCFSASVRGKKKKRMTWRSVTNSELAAHVLLDLSGILKRWINEHSSSWRANLPWWQGSEDSLTDCRRQHDVSRRKWPCLVAMGDVRRGCGKREARLKRSSWSIRESLNQRAAGSRARWWRWRSKHRGRRTRHPSSCKCPWSGWWPQRGCRIEAGQRSAQWSGPSSLPGGTRRFKINLIVSLISLNTYIKICSGFRGSFRNYFLAEPVTSWSLQVIFDKQKRETETKNRTGG